MAPAKPAAAFDRLIAFDRRPGVRRAVGRGPLHAVVLTLLAGRLERVHAGGGGVDRLELAPRLVARDPALDRHLARGTVRAHEAPEDVLFAVTLDRERQPEAV